MWHKNKMFKKNKFMLDKCSIRVYYCGIRTKHSNHTGGKQNEFKGLCKIKNQS